MTNNLKLLVSLFFAILSCLPLQIFSSQAVDEEEQKKIGVKGNKTVCGEEEKRLVEVGSPAPPIAQGYEKIYERFLNGALVYRPNGDGNDDGMITLLIRDLGNPLEGTFDLSRCDDTGKYLSIATGYRKGKKPENSGKVEIWFAPRFLIEKEINTMAMYFKAIMGNWKQEASVGMFWTYGGWAADDHDMDYLITENMDNLSKIIDLYENYKKSAASHQTCEARTTHVGRATGRRLLSFMFRL